MTGLIDNIKAIKNQKSLTFLYRAKVMELESLNITAITSDYQKVFGIGREEAEELAYKTRGYSLAFQALGYHYWDACCQTKAGEKIDKEQVYEKMDITLSELAYEKIWDELSAGDRKVLIALDELLVKENANSVKVEDVRGAVNMKSNAFSTYRTRLLDSGVVDGKQYGYLSIKLPGFSRFIATKKY